MYIRIKIVLRFFFLLIWVVRNYYYYYCVWKNIYSNSLINQKEFLLFSNIFMCLIYGTEKCATHSFGVVSSSARGKTGGIFYIPTYNLCVHIFLFREEWIFAFLIYFFDSLLVYILITLRWPKVIRTFCISVCVFLAKLISSLYKKKYNLKMLHATTTF